MVSINVKSIGIILSILSCSTGLMLADFKLWEFFFYLEFGNFVHLVEQEINVTVGFVG